MADRSLTDMSNSLEIRSVEVTKGVPYKAMDGTLLEGNLYLPETPRPCPLIIAVHGGGWRSGSMARYDAWGKWLAERGIGTFAVSHRPAAEGARFPTQLHDVDAAINFVGQGALPVDRTRLALMGDSSGAHLVAMAALSGRFEAFKRNGSVVDIIAKCRAIVVVYGVYNLLAQWEHDQVARPHDQITEGLMGIDPIQDRLAYCTASPMFHATSGGVKAPFLVCWGMADDVCDFREQSLPFVKNLKQAGYSVRTVPLEGAPHFWIDQSPFNAGSYAAQFAPKLLHFLTSHLA